jgi:hypothetical protein
MILVGGNRHCGLNLLFIRAFVVAPRLEVDVATIGLLICAEDSVRIYILNFLGYTSKKYKKKVEKVFGIFEIFVIFEQFFFWIFD